MRATRNESSRGDRDLLRWVLRRLRLQTRHYVTGTIAAAGASAAAMADPFLLQWLTDHAIASRSSALLLAGAAGLFAASLLRQGLHALSTLANLRASNGFSLRLRRDAIRHAGQLGVEYHTRVSAGHSQFLVERDVEMLTDSLHLGIAQIIGLVSSVGFAALAVYHFEFRLLLAAIPLNLALLVLKRRFGPALQDAATATQTSAAAASATLQDHLQGITQLQLMPGLGWRERAFVSACVAARRTAAAKQRMELAFGAGAGLVTASGLSALVVIAGPRLVSGEMTAGAFLATYLCMGQLLAPALIWSDLVQRLTQTRTILTRIHGFLHEPIYPRGGASPTAFPRPIAITVTDLIFGFRGLHVAGPMRTKFLLQIDSFTAKPGEMIAVIGASGSGKSTLARLLLRQLEPPGGTIRYNGIAVEDLCLRDLRDAVAYCPQGPAFFNGTLRANLQVARPSATAQEMWEALRMAAVEEVVAGFPLGLDCPISPAGGRFSAGERQRLALARTLLQDSAILILDEATSALDPDTEALVLKNLRKGLGRAICIFITHGSAPVEYADRVIAVRDGCVTPVAHAGRSPAPVFNLSISESCSVIKSSHGSS